jgi:hypothetical protein
MSGESNLRSLLKNMTPILHGEEYGYGLVPIRTAIPTNLNWFALMREDTATTIVATITANVVAGYYHDHFFVQWPQREEAVALMRGLSSAV